MAHFLSKYCAEWLTSEARFRKGIGRTLPALLRRTGPEIPVTIRLVAIWPERVTQKTKKLSARAALMLVFASFRRMTFGYCVTYV